MADKECSLLDYAESINISNIGYSFYGRVAALKMIGDDEEVQCVKQEWKTDPFNSDQSVARRIVTKGHSFNGLLASMLVNPDIANLNHIKNQWPTFVEQFIQRYNAPGGKLEGE